jgi:hypothetical protein
MKVKELKQIKRKPDPMIVEHLDTALEMARSGDIQEMIMVCRFDGGGFEQFVSSHDSNDATFMMIGYLESVKAHLIENLLADAEET